MSPFASFLLVSCALGSCLGRRPENCTNYPVGMDEGCPAGFEVKVDEELNAPAFIYCCPKPTCVDDSDECLFYQLDCDVENFTDPDEQVDPEWMKKNCAKTCGFCK